MKIIKESQKRTEEDRRNLTKTVGEIIDYVRENNNRMLEEIEKIINE